LPTKCILILLDGIGDRSHGQLGDLTPLRAAHTPSLDRIASLGANGLYHAWAQGQALSSEDAHFAMFGYESSEFPGRGVLEALGAGVDLAPRDVAVLAHVASVREADGCLVLEEGTPWACDEEAEAVTREIGEYETNGVRIRFTRTKGLFGIVTLSGDVAPQLTDTDPVREGRTLSEVRPWQEYGADPAARNTAEALKAYLLWTYHRLQSHSLNRSRMERGMRPINALVTHRAGRLKPVQPFCERYGLKGLSISSGLVYGGLCAYLGLDFKQAAESGDPARDIADRLITAYEDLDSYDFIHVHTKYADEAGHARDPRYKKEVIEALDAGIGSAIEPIMNDPDILLIVTSDHSTPSSGLLIHSGETVPLAIYGEGVRRDEVQRFDEISAAAGALGSVRGKELMYLILNHLDRAKLQGLMDTPLDQPYWPGDYEPFRLQ
jgi:2,3-bisphosphoglycerate-independent phosphoglycerate mutase